MSGENNKSCYCCKKIFIISMKDSLVKTIGQVIVAEKNVTSMKDSLVKRIGQVIVAKNNNVTSMKDSLVKRIGQVIVAEKKQCNISMKDMLWGTFEGLLPPSLSTVKLLLLRFMVITGSD